MGQIFLSDDVMTKYNKASRQKQVNAFYSLTLASELFFQVPIYVSSLIRSDDPHDQGRSVDVTHVYINSNWFHIGKNSSTWNTLTDTNFTKQVLSWLYSDILSQIICPYYIGNSGQNYKIDYSPQGDNKLLVNDHNDHVHLTFHRRLYV